MPKLGGMTFIPRYFARLAALAVLVVMPCTQAAAVDPAETGKIISPSPSAAAQAEKAAAPDSQYKLSGPALLAISAVILLGGYILIRRAKGNLSSRLTQTAKGAIEICRTRSLGGKQYLVVVQVEGKRMLLGVGPSFITKLTDLEPEDFTIPFERKGKPATAKPEEPETPTYPFNNLITRINESLSRKDDGNGPETK
jgi:flagellar biogenesis protein FliO